MRRTTRELQHQRIRPAQQLDMPPDLRRQRLDRSMMTLLLHRIEPSRLLSAGVMAGALARIKSLLIQIDRLHLVPLRRQPPAAPVRPNGH